MVPPRPDPTAAPNDTVDRVMETMGAEQVRRIPIVDERGDLVGIVSQADIVLRARDNHKAEQTVEEISAPGGRNSCWSTPPARSACAARAG